MHTLIAGGCGFFGLNLAEAHLAAGESVVLLDKRALPDAAARRFATLTGELVHEAVDVTDAEAVRGVFSRHDVDAAYYGAAVTSGAARERDKPEQVVATNVLGLVHVLKAAGEARVRRIINLSSGAAYGTGGDPGGGNTAPLDERASRPLPDTLYGVTKLAGEGACRRLGALYDIDAFSVRLSILYGPWERDTGVRDTLSAPMQIARLLLSGRPALLARRDARDWTYAPQAARAVRELMRADAHGHELYHVTTGRTCACVDIGEALARRFPGAECRLVRDGERPTVDLHGERDRLVMSARRLREDTGAAVEDDLERVTQHFADWIHGCQGYWED